ncbi:Hsp70 family protein, partial [Methylococcus sp. S1M]
TEVGTLQLEAVARDSGERWKVEFAVRSGEKPVPAFDEVSPEAPYLGTLEAPAESVVEGDAGGDEPAGKKPFWSFNK